MENNVTINVGVKEVGGSVKSIKQELREAQASAVQMARTFGENSTEATKAAQKVAKLRDEIEDVGLKIKGLNPDKFQRIATLGQGVAQGFVAAQGAMAMFGGQSQELEKTMVKLQGAIAMSQGLQGLKDLQIAFGDIGASAVKAFNTLKTAIGSTGIGALVIAVGLIATYWDDIADALGFSNAKQEKSLEISKKQAIAEQGKLDLLNSQDETLKRQGKSEQQILDLKILQGQEIVKALEIQSKKEQEALKQSGKSYGIYQALVSAGIPKTIAGIFFNPLETVAKSAENLNVTEKEIIKTKNLIDGYKNKVDEINKKSSADEISRLDKEAEEKQKRLDEEWQSFVDATKRQYDYNNKVNENERKDIADQEAYKKDQKEKGLASLKKVTSDHYNTLITNAKVNHEDTTIIELNALKAQLQIAKDHGESMVDLQNQIAEKEGAIEDQKANKKKKAIEEGFKLALASLQATQALSDIFYSDKLDKVEKGSKAEEAILRKQFETNKKMNIATAIINGAQAINSILAQYPKFDGGFAMVAALATTTITSLAQIAKIKSTKFESTSTPTMPNNIASQTPSINQTVNQQRNVSGTSTGATGQNQVVKVIVTETDITRSQGRVNDIRRRALIH